MDRQVIRVSGAAPSIVLAACLLALGCGGCGSNRDVLHRGLFHAADTDHDGSLSLAEFTAADPDGHLPEDRENEFVEADQDADRRLSFEEFDSTLPRPHPFLWAIGLFSAFSFVGSLVAIPIVVARLPVDHFVAPHAAADWVSSSIARRLWLVLKNLLGILLVAGGVIMLVLPGQGVLTILLGVAVMDLPGKWKAMRALARRPEVMKALNWMRERAQKPPLIPPPAKGDTHREISQLPHRG